MLKKNFLREREKTIENQNITEPSSTTSLSSQEEINNVLIMKRTITVKKTTFPSLKDQYGKNIKAKTEKI